MANLRAYCIAATDQSVLVLPHLANFDSVGDHMRSLLTLSAIMSNPLADERSDDEDEEPSTAAKVKALKGKKAE